MALSRFGCQVIGYGSRARPPKFRVIDFTIIIKISFILFVTPDGSLLIGQAGLKILLTI
jgi:hypothetical protein